MKERTEVPRVLHISEDTKAFEELLDEFNSKFKAFTEQYPDSVHSEINVWVGLGDKPIHFTPGVPTEDGWYVCKVQFEIKIDTIHPAEIIWEYLAVNIRDGFMLTDISDYTILSHAKLPEL